MATTTIGTSWEANFSRGKIRGGCGVVSLTVQREGTEGQHKVILLHRPEMSLLGSFYSDTNGSLSVSGLDTSASSWIAVAVDTVDSLLSADVQDFISAEDACS